jgi:hypothetical protein
VVGRKEDAVTGIEGSLKFFGSTNLVLIHPFMFAEDNRPAENVGWKRATNYLGVEQ